ncbi:MULTISPECIES: LuxR family transcriptional regulator [Paraburkholderia]|uniref:Regulatory protein, luxR family n=1 Tax=Paraburkholderia megapolitana TaxID=420953 RepID=A0A1I3DSH9_9BURK|nr:MULTISPECIES: LuxR family transcriptional regulator [Paraburkholderia]MCX4161445.1 LuxR C-terminal-related transcriptional regulator [Paraburkholderia megapolitana]MDN7156941.1 LuxR family transcriptional regulator [Paraburkholderia sp. CHISQ3]MDQ6493986.1 LuxR family transcriptional regulator [Paraburkholderia megapolitana]QDQ79749.1 LuxR family transcriptional regulator [Paraburkholderia megapolitana]SFH89676.1 regulatory protein, luxR family [Paraburkholderia megapolitana]
MTLCEGTPVLDWFSHTDVLAHRVRPPSHVLDEAVPARGDAAVLTAWRDNVGKSDLFEFDLDECRAQMRRAGFSTLNYGAYEMIGQRLLHAHLLRDLVPVSSVQPYFEGGWHEADPRFASVLQSGFPVAWRLDCIEEEAQRSGDRRTRALAASLRAHAMNSGVIFSLSAPQLELRVGVGLTSEMHDSDWIDDRVTGAALAVSLSVHRFVQPFLEARVRARRAITLEHEQEAVLERLVQGLSDQEIADALNLSLHKVSYHIHRLERTFNVHNRAQLAYLAARRVRA